MVVATEMVMVGTGMVGWWTSRAVAGCFKVQKSDGDFMRGGKPCLLNLMRNRKDGIDGKTNHHHNED